MSPRPFERDSEFASLLIETWKDPSRLTQNSSISLDNPATLEALALNCYSILHDRRIPRDSAAELDRRFSSLHPRQKNDPRTVLSLFTRPSLGSTENEQNRLFGLRDRPAVPRIRLLNAVRLNRRMIAAMRSARNRFPDGLTRFALLRDCLHSESLTPRDPVMPSPWNWLRDQAGEIRSPSDSSDHAFESRLSQTLELLNEARCNSGHGVDNIQWSGGYQEIEEHRRVRGHAGRPDLGESWVAPLGVNHQVGEIFLVFVFDAARAGCLFRPTHLDAGFYREHIPTPVHASTRWSAHPMHIGVDVDESDPALIAEYVHHPIPFYREDLHAVAITRSASRSTEIPRQRQAHWERLNNEYGSDCDLDQALFPRHAGSARCEVGTCSCAIGACDRILP